MANTNTNLKAARLAKDDEFYTTYETVSGELGHYAKHFSGKTVLCNCDDPFRSNFCRYFVRQFNTLGLRRLICTSFAPMSETCLGAERHGHVLDICGVGAGCGALTDEDALSFLSGSGVVRRLDGNGDFRSSECVSYLEQSDIVVTNPPFSLFKELVSLITEHGKGFLLIGNQNALTYKEIFPLIKDGLAWTGYQFGEMKFRVPSSSEPRQTRFWIDGDGQKWRSLGNAMWLTNLDIERRHRFLPLTKKYSPDEHLQYDDYDAVNVRTVHDIPFDYAGIMGVPITIVNRYNSSQFELIGEANHGSDNEFDLFKPTVNGKRLFKRILVRNRLPGVRYFDEQDTV